MDRTMKDAKSDGFMKALRSLCARGIRGGAVFILIPQTGTHALSIYDRALIAAALAMAGPTLTYWGKHLQLSYQVRKGWMTPERAGFFRRRLSDAHYPPKSPDGAERASGTSRSRTRLRTRVTPSARLSGSSVGTRGAKPVSVAQQTMADSN
jgi:hypothetical protein